MTIRWLGKSPFVPLTSVIGLQPASATVVLATFRAAIAARSQPPVIAARLFESRHLHKRMKRRCFAQSWRRTHERKLMALARVFTRNLTCKYESAQPAAPPRLHGVADKRSPPILCTRLRRFVPLAKSLVGIYGPASRLFIIKSCSIRNVFHRDFPINH